MIILTICAISIFAWLLFEVIKLSLKVAWGLAKVIGIVLCAAAFPLLIVLAVTASGFILLLPVALLAAAFGVLKQC